MIKSDKDRLLTLAAWSKVMDGEPVTAMEIDRIISVLREPGLIPYSMSQEEMVGLRQKLSSFLTEWQQAVSQQPQ